VAPKLLLLPAAVTLKLKVPDVADSAAILVFPKLLELPAAVTLVLKVPKCLNNQQNLMLQKKLQHLQLQ